MSALSTVCSSVRRPLSALAALCVLVALVLVTACGTPVAAAGKGPPGGPVEVGVVTLVPAPVTLTRELPGRVSALRVAEVRARVNGIVLKRLFEEGSDVKAGQELFRIDARPYRASLASAKASLARARASAGVAKQQEARVKELVGAAAASQEQYESADATLKVAEADAAAGRAALQTAKLNLEYATVTAPVDGRIGRAEVTEGAYVQQTGATLMARIQQIDRVYVDFTQSAAEALRLRHDLETGKLQSEGGAAKVTLVLEDGRVYDEPGTLQFTDVTVDESTGSISLRASFPNPRRELLPGMFVRARIAEGTSPQAILVPQRAVTRDPKGQASALVVNAEKKVERRTFVTERSVGDAWLVVSGLQAGDQVIVEGLQKVRPGAEVVAVPAAEDPKLAANTGAPASGASADAGAPKSAGTAAAGTEAGVKSAGTAAASAEAGAAKSAAASADTGAAKSADAAPTAAKSAAASSGDAATKSVAAKP